MDFESSLRCSLEHEVRTVGFGCHHCGIDIFPFDSSFSPFEAKFCLAYFVVVVSFFLFDGSVDVWISGDGISAPYESNSVLGPVRDTFHRQWNFGFPSGGLQDLDPVHDFSSPRKTVRQIDGQKGSAFRLTEGGRMVSFHERMGPEIS